MKLFNYIAKPESKSYCSQLELAFQAIFFHENPIFFSLLAIFFVPLTLENSQKENRMRWLESSDPGSFWLGAIVRSKVKNSELLITIAEKPADSNEIVKIK